MPSTAGRFDAASDRVSYTGATPPPDTATGISFTCWASLAVDLNDNSSLWRLWSSVFGTRVNMATATNGETPALFSAGNTGGVVAPLSLVVDTWRAVGCAISGTTGTIRIAPADLSAALSASGTVSGGATAAGFTLGGRDTGDSTEWFNGRIAYPRVWAGLLDGAEMLTEWASLTPVRGSGLWGAWELPSLADVSGNGRNLTAGTTPLTAEAGPPITSGSATRFLPFFS
ncbi:hypothetical protein [Actinophytocola sp.]|uniref:hypothetical protein n=1 Tax=Actinophytocola sp. TaxID=1872138 RepID=UPI002D7F3D9B|nr:hypothetical protein [Actinophytocola sp.]HET9144161.1 hypothetical protein [Actinophytocola sp.]